MANNAGTLQILSWNINGFKIKKDKVKQQLELRNVNVALLQETHIGEGEEDELKIGWSPFSPCTACSPTEKGVAILIGKEMGFKKEDIIHERRDANGRYIVLNCRLKEEIYTFISVYFEPNKKRQTEKMKSDKETQDATQITLEEINNILKNLDENGINKGIIVAAGDFNTVLNNELDKTSHLSNQRHKQKLKHLEDFLQEYNLVDTWRILHPNDKKYTFYVRKEGISRLDYFFITEETLHQRVLECNIHPRPKNTKSSKPKYISDHAPITLQLLTSSQPWQFDKTLLQNENLVKRLTDIIETFSEKKNSETWMGLKSRLRCEEFVFSKMPSENIQSCIMQAGGDESCNIDSDIFPDLVGNLLTGNVPDLQTLLNKAFVDHVSETQILLEIQSLHDFGNQTSDGFPVQFYKVFRLQLSKSLMFCINDILDSASVIMSFKQVIVLKDRECPKSCFNVDYMIFTTILARRLNSFLKHSVKEEQVSVEDYLSPIRQATSRGSRILVIVSFLDIDKNFLDKLQQSDLPPELIKILNELIREPESSVLYLDCPLIPVLLKLCLKPLVQKLYQEVRIEVLEDRQPIVHIERNTIVIFMTSPSKESLVTLQNVLKEFNLSTGVRIHYDKCISIPIVDVDKDFQEVLNVIRRV